MFNFWDNMIKRKRVAVWAVLFFVLTGMLLFVVMPISVSASAATIGAQMGAAAAGAGATEQEYIDTSWLDPAPAGVTPSIGVLRWIGNLLLGLLNVVKNVGDYLFSGPLIKLFATLISLFSWVIKQIAEGSAILFRYVLSEIIVDAERVGGAGQVERAENQWAITRGGGNTAVLLIAWNIVKNWANMVIVLLLIAAAAMMILRLWADKAKKLLTDVIILALLINFSIVFVGLIIDASNILTKTLIVGAEQEVLIVKQIDKAWNAVARPLSKPIDWGGVGRYLAIAGLLDIMYLIAAFVLLAFSLIVIQRYIVLAILFILSPLAFAFRIFPHESATGLWNSWWQNFLKYCFMLVPAAFFLRLSSEILVALDWGEMRKPEHLTVLVFNFIIVMGFLVAGLIITKKSMGPVVGAVMGAATKIATGTVGLAAGAAASLGWKGAKGLGGAAANATGATRAYNAATSWAGDKLTAIGEKTRVLKQGALANRKMSRSKITKEDEEAAANMAKATPEQFKGVVKGNAWTPAAIKQKVAAIKHATKEGKLGDHFKTAEEQADALKYADKHTGMYDEEMWDKAAQKNADVAKHDTVKVDKEKKKLVGQNSPKTFANNPNKKYTYSERDFIEGSYAYDEMQKEAEENAVKKAYPKMKVENIENESNETVAQKAKAKTAEGSKYLEEAIKRKILGMVGAFEKVGDLIQHSSDNLGSNAATNAAKIDPRYIKYDKKAMEDAEKELMDETGGPSPVERAIKNQVGKLSGDQFAELDPNAQRETANYASPQVLQRAILKASSKGKEAIIDGILADVENLDFDKLALVPETEVENAINRATPEVKDKIEKKFGVPKIVRNKKQRMATQEDVNKNIVPMTEEDYEKKIIAPAQKKGTPVKSYKEYENEITGRPIPMSAPPIGSPIDITEEDMAKERETSIYMSDEAKETFKRLRELKEKEKRTEKEEKEMNLLRLFIEKAEKDKKDREQRNEERSRSENP